MRFIRIVGWVVLALNVTGALGAACMGNWGICFADVSAALCWALLLWQDSTLFRRGWTECKWQVFEAASGRDNISLGELIDHLDKVFKDCYKKR